MADQQGLALEGDGVAHRGVVARPCLDLIKSKAQLVSDQRPLCGG